MVQHDTFQIETNTLPVKETGAVYAYVSVEDQTSSVENGKYIMWNFIKESDLTKKFCVI